VRGATVYVTLEPCAHQGRTGPCCEALVQAGVSRVVVAVTDPNPLVNSAGIDHLRAHGVQVDVGLCAQQALELNIGFFQRMTLGRPWVRMKIAASLDGQTALSHGASQWITGEAARADGHAWRARACAILSGHGTWSWSTHAGKHPPVPVCGNPSDPSGSMAPKPTPPPWVGFKAWGPR
jgi:diaminohydroxyphosphoribosylaminopyrimidine deaminase/5-amino-6-(5-phosphoribosylamino)uracil reductase